MKDNEKTQKQLIKELTQLRQRIAELEKEDTERKQAEEKLLRLIQQNELILSSAAEGILGLDLQGNHTFVNPAAARMLGYEVEELLGRHSHSTWHHTKPDGSPYPKEECAIYAAYRDGAVHRASNEVFWRKDDTSFPVEYASTPIYEQGRLAGAVVTFTEITERKQAEEALRGSEQRYRGLFEGTAEGILIADLKSKQFLYANPSICNMLGYSMEELRNLSVRDIHPSESLEHVISEFEAQARGKKLLAPAIPCLRKNGTIMYADIVTSKILIDNKECNAGFFTDVTERKRAQEELRKSETRFRTLFEAIPDTVLVHDDEGTILHINEIGAQQLEWSVKDLVGRNLREIVTHENRTSIADHIKETHKVGWCRFETTYVSRSGWQIIAEVNERPIKFGKKKAILSVARDISKRKEAEKALLEEKKFSDSIMNSSPGLLFVIGDKGNTIKWNMNVEIVTGYSANEISKMNVLDFVSQEDKKIAAEAVQEALTTGQSSIAIDVLTKPGKKIPFFITGRRTKIENAICLVCTGMDVTERKQAEEALHKSEQKQRSIIENIQEGYFENDLAGNFTFVNDALCRILGYPKEELIEKNNRQYTDEKTAKKIYQVYNRIYRTGEPSKGIEEEYIRKDGTKLFAELSVSLISDAEGKPIGFRGIARDVTERKQAEEALRLSEEKYRDLVENINDIIYTTDERGIVTYIAPGIESLSGYAPSEIIGRSFSEFVYPEDIPSMMDKFQEVVSGHAEAHEYRMVTKSGDVRWARTSSSPFFKETRVIGLRGVMADITDLKLAEEALRESEQLYRGLFEGAADGILIADLKSKQFLYANPSICNMLGYSEEELRNLSVRDIHPSESLEHVISEFKAQARGEKSLASAIPCLRKNGTIVYADIVTSKILIDNKECNVGFFTDITERKQAEEEVKRSYEQQRQALLATVSALATTVEMKDQYTAGHQPRVTQLACSIAEEMGLPAGQIEGIRMAASIHDIGKIVVPAEILNKPGPLTELQFEMIKMHPKAGYDILKGIQFPWPVAEIVQQHHERLDGSGYPQGLSGDKIMLAARILIVANVVEAMTAHRLYRPALDIKEALAEISKNRGVLYDPTVVDICVKLFTEKAFMFSEGAETPLSSQAAE